MTFLETKKVSEIYKKKLDYGLGNRHLQAFMLFLALVNAFAMRVNISVAIVTMTDETKENHFVWSIQTQSIILSSYFWGYGVMQIPGGELAGRFGGKILILTSIGINSVVSLAFPTLSYHGGWQVTCICRVIQGLFQGVLFPSVHSLIGKWVPLEEKSSIGTMVYAGTQLGTALQMMVSGIIADRWGWEAIFYTNGILGLIWAIAYFYLGASSPSASRMISDKERYLIEESLGHSGSIQKLKTPWKSIFTSLPLWSLLITHCGFSWGFYTLVTEMPSYMSQILGVNIKSNGVLSALPYLAMFIISFPMGHIYDLVLRKKWLSITAARKLSNCIGFYGPAIALFGLSYSPVGNVSVAVILLCLVVGLNAGHFTGFLLVHIDMSPNFAGTMMGITNFFANFAAILAPIAAGWIIQDEKDPGEWRKVFYITSAIYIITNTIFTLCGTSNRQPWDESASEKEPEPKNKGGTA